jgi:hypothetical protein
VHSPATALLTTDIQPATLIELEEAARLVGRLDGRISGTSVRQAWTIRASWAGYAEALRLQGAEIDDIDIFAWSCGVALPRRPRRTSHLDELSGFTLWRERLANRRPGAWRDALPFTPSIAMDQPVLLRALGVVRHYAIACPGLDPWLLLPIALRELGASETMLPCIVAGAKAYRDPRRLSQESLRASLRSLSTRARAGLALLDGVERDHRHATATILAERRPGALRPLAALSLFRPLLSPMAVASALALSLSGAGKLLDRAAGLGLLREISGRTSWKTYLAPDLAIAFGFASPERGRPRIEPPRDATAPDLAAVLAAFDRDMAAFDARFGTSGTADAAD